MASLVYCVICGASDEGLDIAAGLRRRDPDLLDRLIEEHQHRLLRYLISLTADRTLAADLFQETWLRVLERGHRYDGRSRFVAWLLTVARNLAIDALRARRSISLDAPTSGLDDEAPLQIQDRGPGPYERLAVRLEEERLALFLSCLPAHYREVLVLRFHEDLSLEEIAAVTGAPLSTVKSRLARGLKAFGARLKESR